ncbi:lipase maturation factor 2 isoform X2 [Nematostella vectensis]|uniref:lipase maturation factor 2 isoform X2 n=1 Tax=Nematostella vectensis TaxID=45351 RepID=UPI0020772945|nr:lipase maturation factor 2 isoform X2 [Nematostella vectensis]
MAGHGKQILVRRVFLWGLSAIYLFAFASLYIQIPGLYGRNGILPARLALQSGGVSTWEDFRARPTLLWYMPNLGLDTETGMELLAITGIFVSLLAMSMDSWRDSGTFVILWYLYYSLYQVGQTFLWFQWDILLLEMGFLAILVAPFTMFLSRQENSRHHDSINLWLVKWLVFRLMFCSGVVKLNSECDTWWNLTALDWHYESQCIPTPLAWYAHQLPKWFQRLSVVLTYVILIVLSILFFAPVRSLRIFSFYAQIFFQLLIILTGNYNFFNLLAVLACFSILDDEHIKFIFPTWLVDREPEPVFEEAEKSVGFAMPPCSRVKRYLRKCAFMVTIGTVAYWTLLLFDLRFSSKQIIHSKITFSKRDFFTAISMVTPITIWIGLGSLCVEIVAALIGCILERGILAKIWSLLQWAVFSFAALGMFAISLVPYTDIDYNTQQQVWPVIKRWKQQTDFLELVNAYGLFRRMTGVGGRPEVVVEGSHSLEGPWTEYKFLYKPGDVNRPLPVVAPHQPRVDWQMWFAALGSYNHNPWFVHMVYRLLHGQQEVLDLLDRNPFKGDPPRYIRASLYTYHYTKLPGNTSGLFDAYRNSKLIKSWWTRKYVDNYLPVVSKDEPTLITWLNHFGYATGNPWPEHPNGRLYRIVKHFRFVVRTMDPLVFILALLTCGMFMSIAHASLDAPITPNRKRDSTW